MRQRAITMAALFVALALAGCTGTPAEAPPVADGGPAGNGTAGPGHTTGAPSGPDGPGDPADPDEQVQRTWVDPDAAAIRPGVQMTAKGQQCTSNFAFTSPHNDTVYLGFAAHCVADGGQMETNGCDGPVPFDLGTSVEVEGARHDAELVYSSWHTMQAKGERGADACRYNDFAFVALHPDDANATSPAMRGFGGPTEMAPNGTGAAGGKVLTYGNTGLRMGIEPTNPREGYIVQHAGGGWSTTVYTVTAGLPGDSGSAVLHGDGRAMGVLVTVALTPYAASNGVTSLDRALAYANDHGWGLEVATWDLLDDGDLP